MRYLLRLRQWHDKLFCRPKRVTMNLRIISLHYRCLFAAACLSFATSLSAQFAVNNPSFESPVLAPGEYVSNQ